MAQFFAKIGKTRIFLKNRALSLFNPYWPLKLHAKNQKNPMIQFREKAERTDGWTDDGQTAWIHKTSLSSVQNYNLHSSISINYKDLKKLFMSLSRQIYIYKSLDCFSNGTRKRFTQFHVWNFFITFFYHIWKLIRNWFMCVRVSMCVNV